MSAWLDLGLIPVSAFLFDEEPDNIFKTVHAVMCSAMFPYLSFADTSLLLWPSNRCLNWCWASPGGKYSTVGPLLHHASTCMFQRQQPFERFPPRELELRGEWPPSWKNARYPASYTDHAVEYQVGITSWKLGGAVHGRKGRNPLYILVLVLLSYEEYKFKMPK